MQHAWCMLFLLENSILCSYTLLLKPPDLMQYFQENKGVEVQLYVLLVHVHSQGADVGGEGWLGCEPVEGVVVLEER